MISRSNPRVARSVCGSVKFWSTVKTGRPFAPAGMLDRLTRSTPDGFQLAPHVGASGSKHETVPTLQFGSVGSSPAVFVVEVYWTPRRPLEEKSWAQRMAGVRLQYRPTDPRMAVLGSGEYENDRRGDHWFLTSGIWPVSGNWP